MAKNKIKVGLSDIKSSVKEVTKSVEALDSKAENFFKSITDSMKEFINKNEDATNSLVKDYGDMFSSIERRGKKSIKTLSSYLDSLKKSGIDLSDLSFATKRKQIAVTNALKAIGAGKITATSPEVTALAQKKAYLDDVLSPSVFAPVVSSIRSTLAQGTLGRAGFGNLTSSLTTGYDKYKEKKDTLRQANIEAQEGYAKQRTELETSSIKYHQLYKQGKIDKVANDATQAQIAKDMADITAKSEASKVATEKLATAETASFIQGVTGDLMVDIAIIVTKQLMELFKEAKKMIDDVSTYSLSTSYKVNAQAREQALQYGLSDAQNYAFTQTRELMGIRSDEDMYYMNANQRRMFSSLMDKEMEFYNRLNSNGTLEGFQEMQMDFALLKQEFVTTVGEFIVDNKDTIISFAKVGLEALTFIAEVLNGIFKGISMLNPVNWFNAPSSSNVITVNTTNRFYDTGSKSADDISNAISDKERVALSNFFNS